VDSVTLLSHVAPIYYKELKEFPLRLVELLEEHHLVTYPLNTARLADLYHLVNHQQPE
jgi:hypothetical protein